MCHAHAKCKSTALFCVYTGPMGKRQDTRDRIEAQIVELGPTSSVTRRARPGCQLRAIARDLGMVSSAVYRYVASRDDLLTLLLVDAYSDLADAVDAARARAADGWRDQITAIAHAARPGRSPIRPSWTLLYGSPVPGYHAPAGGTVGSRHPGGRRVVRRGGGRYRRAAPSASRISKCPALSADFDRLRDEFDFAGDDAAVAKCFALWAGLVGAISLEVFGQYGVRHADRPGTDLRCSRCGYGCTCWPAEPK